MRKVLAILIMFTGASAANAADTRDQECKDWTQEIIRNPATACSDLCPQALRFDKYDYVKGLSTALSSHAGLSNFLSYTGRSSIIGAGADAQACNVYALLLRWGDDTFAQVTSEKPPSSRVRVVGLLDYAAVSEFQARFPHTYALAKHVE